MAQMAGAEALALVLSGGTRSLFETGPGDVRRALARLHAGKPFGLLVETFFGRLTFKALDYYLSRALADHVGDGRRFASLDRQARFTDALETHCQEAARYVRRFAGDWLSKVTWESGDITRDDALKLAHGALNKIVDELTRGAQAYAG
jgi:hypothetical protein